MKRISLALCSSQGDQIAVIPLPGHQLAGPGETSAGAPVDLRGEMERLHAHIEERVAAEGMEIALDPIDARIAISRGLLTADEAEARVRLPVRAKTADKGAPPPAPAQFDDLFQLDDVDEEGFR